MGLGNLYLQKRPDQTARIGIQKHIILMADIIGSSLLPKEELETFFAVVE